MIFVGPRPNNYGNTIKNMDSCNLMFLYEKVDSYTIVHLIKSLVEILQQNIFGQTMSWVLKHQLLN